ncbi:hypothetical protein PMAYCL1PPCAC_02904, partial [Pristionchus mayeri]
FGLDVDVHLLVLDLEMRSVELHLNGMLLLGVHGEGAIVLLHVENLSPFGIGEELQCAVWNCILTVCSFWGCTEKARSSCSMWRTFLHLGSER